MTERQIEIRPDVLTPYATALLEYVRGDDSQAGTVVAITNKINNKVIEEIFNRKPWSEETRFEMLRQLAFDYERESGGRVTVSDVVREENGGLTITMREKT